MDPDNALQELAAGKTARLTVEYVGHQHAVYGDLFVGGGGGLYQWKWHKPSERKHHIYRVVGF